MKKKMWTSKDDLIWLFCLLAKMQWVQATKLQDTANDRISILIFDNEMELYFECYWIIDH